MDKAYDIKVLKQKLVANGLPVVETMAEIVYKSFMEWVVESAPLSESKIDDVVITFKQHIDTLVLPQLDKIDKKEG